MAADEKSENDSSDEESEREPANDQSENPDTAKIRNGKRNALSTRSKMQRLLLTFIMKV